jgi:hypothetical protein
VGLAEPGSGAVEVVGGDRGRYLEQEKCYKKMSWIGVGSVLEVAA